ncbi:hypothetical protein D1007_55360 [Hordeum vulgare]|nr:hypothetical protein D1007_55360 [Hordeum vulgare]
MFSHAQFACTNPPCCYICKDPGHPALLCPNRPVTDELMMYGHDIEGLGFFHIKVTPTTGNEFTIILPDAGSHGYSTRSTDITLDVNKLVVYILEPIRDLMAVAVLETAWILVSGLPNIARRERVIRNMSRILGIVVMVDELSLRKEEEVRVKVQRLNSSKLRATVRVFSNSKDFDLKIAPERPNHVGHPPFSDEGHSG